MAAPEDSPRQGFRVPLRGGPAVPLAGICVGVLALTAVVTLGGEDSSSNTGDEGVVRAMAATGPAALPAANNCALNVGGTSRAITAADARTLTQIAAVGWQVKAPAEMVARVLDVATAEPGRPPSVTDALDLFTREDSTVPTASSVAEIRALTEPGGLTCVFPAPAGGTEPRGKSGLTPRADTLRRGIVDAFGQLTMSSFSPKAKNNPAGAAGRALSVSVPAVSSPEAGTGWVLAHWLTARGADFKLDTVAYGDRVWSPVAGWTTAAPGSAAAAPVRAGRLFVSVTAGAAAAKDSAKKSTKGSKSGSKKKAKQKS